MYVIGVCGKSGSGKSTAAAFLKKRGAFNIDADEVCRYVYECNLCCINELCSCFGEGILCDGAISRPRLKAAAYEKENGFAVLNSVSHKYIIAEIEQRLETAAANDKRIAVIDAPLLFEAGLDSRCDGVIAVVSPHCKAVERLKKRDGVDKDSIEKRLSMQLSVHTLAKKSDCVIFNNGSLSDLRRKAYLAMFYIQLKLGAVENIKKGRHYVKKQG